MLKGEHFQNHCEPGDLLSRCPGVTPSRRWRNRAFSCVNLTPVHASVRCQCLHSLFLFLCSHTLLVYRLGLGCASWVSKIMNTACCATFSVTCCNTKLADKIPVSQSCADYWTWRVVTWHEKAVSCVLVCTLVITTALSLTVRLTTQQTVMATICHTGVLMVTYFCYSSLTVRLTTQSTVNWWTASSNRPTRFDTQVRLRQTLAYTREPPPLALTLMSQLLVCRVGQNRVFKLYMTVYSVISLLRIPYIHHTYMAWANPNFVWCLTPDPVLLLHPQAAGTKCLVYLKPIASCQWMDLVSIRGGGHCYYRL